MPPRHLPALWLMTDERIGDALLPAIRDLPRGSGIVFRHHATPATARARLWRAVRAAARARGLMLVLAGDRRLRGADGRHGHRPGCLTAPAHGVRELISARRAGCALAFLSPVFPTRSHPGAPALGPVRFGLMAQAAGLPVIALGGMDPRRARRLRPLGAAGWAAIDGLSRPAGRLRDCLETRASAFAAPARTPTQPPTE